MSCKVTWVWRFWRAKFVFIITKKPPNSSIAFLPCPPFGSIITSNSEPDKEPPPAVYYISNSNICKSITCSGVVTVTACYTTWDCYTCNTTWTITSNINACVWTICTTWTSSFNFNNIYLQLPSTAAMIQLNLLQLHKICW